MTIPEAYANAEAVDQEYARCPACQAQGDDPVWSVNGSQAFTVRRCRRCRLVFTVPQPGPDALHAFYDERYYGTQNIRFGALIERVVQWFARQRADAMCRLAPPGRVLDVGCGRGHTLAALRGRGWTVAGVELTDAAARRARSLGIDVTVGPYRSEMFPAASFDAVILWHVLEHLVDPRAVLRGLSRLLRLGGLVAIAVPNIESRQAALMREDWFHLNVPLHTLHFSEAWLRTALDAAGFRVLAVQHVSFEYDVFGWVQSLLNRCGLRYNLLYEMLKSPSARTLPTPWRTHPIQAIVSAVGLALLLVPASLMAVVDWVGRRGATIELFARKERVP